jgi:hypothetical protein
LFQGAPLNFAKLLLTYVVPFCVSTYGTWSAVIAARYLRSIPVQTVMSACGTKLPIAALRRTADIEGRTDMSRTWRAGRV